MAGAVPTLYWFDRWDDRLGILRVAGTLVHSEELGGEDVLDFSSPDVPAKGDRILWRDGGTWREHVVVRTEEPAQGPCRVHAESSLCEMLRDFIEERSVSGKTASEALGLVLAPTRWAVGTVEPEGKESCLLYHTNCLAALRRVAEVWGGEIVARIGVAGERVSSRTVDLVGRTGSWRGLRLEYGRNVAGIGRTVLDDEVFTALYGFGAGLPYTDEEGNYKAGYRRKLTFGDVNDGLDYVADEAAREMWGRWDAGRKAKAHAFGQVTFPECTDSTRLLALTRRALAEACQPKVTYDVDALALGPDVAGLGDDVAVIDTSREPEWRLRARVVRRVREFGDAVTCRLEVGTVAPADYRTLSTVAADVVALADDVSSMDGQLSATATTTYVRTNVSQQIDELDRLEDESF
jgi:phage minor structural protein